MNIRSPASWSLNQLPKAGDVHTLDQTIQAEFASGPGEFDGLGRLKASPEQRETVAKDNRVVNLSGRLVSLSHPAIHRGVY